MSKSNIEPFEMTNEETGEAETVKPIFQFEVLWMKLQLPDRHIYDKGWVVENEGMRELIMSRDFYKERYTPRDLEQKILEYERCLAEAKLALKLLKETQSK